MTDGSLSAEVLALPLPRGGTDHTGCARCPTLKNDVDGSLSAEVSALPLPRGGTDLTGSATRSYGDSVNPKPLTSA